MEYTERRDVSVNDVYWVPIKEVSFLECLDGVAVGHRETKTLSEGRDAESAKDNLSKYPGCVDNWNKLTSEQKTRIPPFLIDLSRDVEKVLYCERRFKNSREDYTCGKPVNENGEYDFKGLNGEFGGCCINGYHVPDFLDCPYDMQLVELGFRD